MKILRAALTYFAVVFGAAFLLGTIRVLWVVPRLSGTFGSHAARYAELVELPILVVVMMFVARWVIRRFVLPQATGRRLSVGFVALAFVLVSEYIMIRARGSSLAEYFATLDP